MFGILAAPLLELTQKMFDFKTTPVLARVGDRFQFRSIDREEYDSIKEACTAGTYRYKITDAEFDLSEYQKTFTT